VQADLADIKREVRDVKAEVNSDSLRGVIGDLLKADTRREASFCKPCAAH
jgi:hypothetical protein